tara:strand:- start:367 stop:555 length:189 start_codon:yes stop_codon:yes gene_type:complete
MKRIIRYFTLRSRLKKAIKREGLNKQLIWNLQKNAPSESRQQHHAARWEEHKMILNALEDLL